MPIQVARTQVVWPTARQYATGNKTGLQRPSSSASPGERR